MRNSSERNTRNFSFKSSTPSSSDKSLSLSPSPILQTNTKSLNLRQSTGLDAPFVKTIPSACPLKEPLPDILLNFEKIPQIENPGSVQGLNSKSREHQRNESKDLKEKSEENNLIFLLFSEIERLLLLLNDRDKEIERLKKLQSEKNDEETSDKNAKSLQRNNSSRNSKISIGENEKNFSPSRFSKKNTAENHESVWKKKWEQENKLHVDLQHKYNLLLQSKNQTETEKTKSEGVGDGVVVNFKDKETQTQKNEDNWSKNSEKKRGTNVQINLDSGLGQKNVGDINEAMSTKETNRDEIKTIEKLWQDDRKNIESLKKGMEQRENIIQKQEIEIQKNFKKMTDLDNLLCVMKKDFDGKIKSLISECRKKDNFIEENEKNFKAIKFELEASLTKNKNLSEELKIRASIIENLKENVAENFKNHKRFLMNIDENEQRSDIFFKNQIKLLECKTSAYEDIFSEKKKEFEENLLKSQKENDELKKTIDNLKLQIEKLEREKFSLNKLINNQKTANENLRKIIKLTIENKGNPKLIEKELEKLGDIEFFNEIKDYLRDFNETDKNKFLTKIIRIITNEEGYPDNVISKIIENELEKSPNSEELKDSKEFLMNFVEKEKKRKNEKEREKSDLRDFNETLKKQIQIIEKEKEKCELKTKEEIEKNGALRKILLLMTDLNESSIENVSKTIGDSLKKAYKAEDYQEINERIMNFLMKQSDCMKILSDVRNSPSAQKNKDENNKSINLAINEKNNYLAQTEKVNKHLTIEYQNTEPKKKTRAIYLTTNSEKKEPINSEQNPFFRTMENYLKISSSDLNSDQTEKNKVDGKVNNSKDIKLEMNDNQTKNNIENEKEMQLVSKNLNFETKENPDHLVDYHIVDESINYVKNDKNKKSTANQQNHQIIQKTPNLHNEHEKLLINTPNSRNPYLEEINISQEKITDEQVFQNRLSQAITIFHSKLLGDNDSHIGEQLQSSLSQIIDTNGILTKSKNIGTTDCNKIYKSNNNENSDLTNNFQNPEKSNYFQNPETFRTSKFDPSNNFQNPESFGTKKIDQIGIINASFNEIKAENQEFSTHKKPEQDKTNDYINTESNMRLLTFNNDDDFLSPKKRDHPIEFFGSRENQKANLENDRYKGAVFKTNIVEPIGEREDFQNEDYSAFEEKPFFSEQKNKKNKEFSDDYFTNTKKSTSQRANDYSNRVSMKEKEFVRPSEHQIPKGNNENSSNHLYQHNSKSIESKNSLYPQKKIYTEQENNENSIIKNSLNSHDNRECDQNFAENINPKLKSEISAKECLRNNQNEENTKFISASKKLTQKNHDSTQPAERRIFNQHRRGSASFYDILRELKHSENVFKIVAIENESLSKITKENEAIFKNDVNSFIKKIKNV